MDRRTFLVTSGLVGAHVLCRSSFGLDEKTLESSTWVERSEPLMGSFTSIAVFHNDPQKASDVITSCFSYLRTAISKISYWEEQSQASLLNKKRTLPLSASSPELLSLIEKTEYSSKLTKGFFNPFISSLLKMWEAGGSQASLPDSLQIKTELQKIKQNRIAVSANAVTLQGSNSLDFGGIGKGFIADAGVAFLQKVGVKYAKVACSGDIAFLGNTEWEVDIEHPRDEGKMLGTTIVKGSMAISTSGDYRNAWYVNGKRFHHLINPMTGYPGTTNCSSTVIAKESSLADALATATFLMEPTQAIALLQSLPQTEGVIVSSDGTIHKTLNFNLISA